MIRKLETDSVYVTFLVGGREVVAPIRFIVRFNDENKSHQIWDTYGDCWVNPGYAKASEALQPVADMLNLIEVEPVTE